MLLLFFGADSDSQRRFQVYRTGYLIQLPVVAQTHTSDSEVQNIPNIENTTSLHVESVKEDPIAEWPSFGRLLTDLSKLAFEAMGNAFVSLFPLCLRRGGSGTTRGLTPIKDSLIMPDDQPEPPLTQRHRSPPHTEPIHVSSAPTNYTQQKPQKSKSGSLKDPSLSSAKHRSSSKRPDFAEFYASSDTPQYSQLSNSKSQKERSRQRYREKSGETVSGVTGGESKPAETKLSDCSDPKFDHFNIRSKFATDHLFRL